MSSYAYIGEDVFISKSAEITRPQWTVIGNHVAIDSFFYCTTKLKIQDYVHISPHVAVIGGERSSLIVGNFCFISVGSRLVCASEKFFGAGLIGPLVPKEYRDDITENCDITMENFSGICASVTVLPGVTISEGSVVGACSLVTKNTEPWTIYKGIPAKAYKKRDSKKILNYAKKMGY